MGRPAAQQRRVQPRRRRHEQRPVVQRRIVSFVQRVLVEQRRRTLPGQQVVGRAVFFQGTHVLFAATQSRESRAAKVISRCGTVESNPGRPFLGGSACSFGITSDVCSSKCSIRR